MQSICCTLNLPTVLTTWLHPLTSSRYHWAQRKNPPWASLLFPSVLPAAQMPNRTQSFLEHGWIVLTLSLVSDIGDNRCQQIHGISHLFNTVMFTFKFLRSSGSDSIYTSVLALKLLHCCHKVVSLHDFSHNNNRFPIQWFFSWNHTVFSVRYELDIYV